MLATVRGGAARAAVGAGQPISGQGGQGAVDTFRRFDAAEAQRLGVISRVVPHDELRAAAVEAAQQVLQTSPEARMHVKRMLNQRYGDIDDQTMFWALDHSPEPREGMRAFMEKRPPSWVPQGDGGTGA